MIEQQTINGRPATVAYLVPDGKGTFASAPDKQSAALIKVLFDDGEQLFLVPEEPPVTKSRKRK